MRRIPRTGPRSLVVLAVAVLAAWGVTGAVAQGAGRTVLFPMVRSAVLPAGCVPNAAALVTDTSNGPTETLTVSVRGLPANTDFDFFVIQVPRAPFGLSWYQGDIETGSNGTGTGVFIGRFNVETFIVAPGVAPAPVVHTSPIRDAASNPATAPVHTYHLGLWFNNPTDAQNAGCPNTVTPFNGEHDAGVQVLNTGTFPDNAGPLRQLAP
jgi:hypothetical protein